MSFFFELTILLEINILLQEQFRNDRSWSVNERQVCILYSGTTR